MKFRINTSDLHPVPATSFKDCEGSVSGRGKRVVFMKLCRNLLIAWFACWMLAEPLEAQSLLIGEQEEISSFRQRRNRIGRLAPDGSIGVLPARRGRYDFYIPDGPRVVRLTGTLDRPARARRRVQLRGIPNGVFDYVAGGPVFEEPITGARFMIYHAEMRVGGPQMYYSVLGMAVSTHRNGLRFQDLGVIISPNRSIDEMIHSLDVGGGSFVIVDDHLYVYYRDYLAPWGSAELAVARISMFDLLANTHLGIPLEFEKYYQGEWGEPGIGGRASPLEVGNPSNHWSAVSYNRALGQFVLAVSQWTPDLSDLYIATSPDGLNWTPRQPLDVGPGEQIYPTIIGTEPVPYETGEVFYVYYTESMIGRWYRWEDARFVRRRIEVLPPDNPQP